MPSSLGTRGGGGSSHHGGGRGDKLVTISPERGYGKSSDDEFQFFSEFSEVQNNFIVLGCVWTTTQQACSLEINK